MRSVACLIALLLCPPALAACPDVGIAPRTLGAPAAQYAQSDKFGIGDDGVLFYDYGTRYENLGKFRNPYFISNYANALYRDYLASECTETEFLDAFLVQAEYLYESAEMRNGMAVWVYPFPAEEFDLEPGWISGIGQARIAGVLERAFVLTDDEKFDRQAKAAMEVFRVSPVNGGVATIDGDVTWFEEAPDPNGQSYKILNGHITAMVGILDIYQITGDPEWKELFDRGVAAVRRDIAKFDAGFLSYYSLASPGFRQMAARKDYNVAHVHQLLWLYDRTGDAEFLEWASRFQAYEMNRDKYSAKGSVDPVNFGPDEAAGFYGGHYWSHSDFPTWLQVDVVGSDYFSGIAVHGNSPASAPRDFTVSALFDGKWTVVAKDRGNTDIRRVIEFTYPVLADAFRLDIDSDNGNRNVAVQAFMPIRQNPQFAPIVNDCNYSPLLDAEYHPAPFRIEDLDVRCAGWLAFPTADHGGIQIEAVGPDSAQFGVEVSDDMATWEPVTSLPINGSVAIPPSEFARLTFDHSIEEITSVTLDLPMVDASQKAMDDRIAP